MCTLGHQQLSLASPLSFVTNRCTPLARYNKTKVSRPSIYITCHLDHMMRLPSCIAYIYISVNYLLIRQLQLATNTYFHVSPTRWPSALLQALPLVAPTRQNFIHSKPVLCSPFHIPRTHASAQDCIPPLCTLKLRYLPLSSYLSSWGLTVKGTVSWVLWEQ